MIDLPQLPTFTGKGLLGILRRDATIDPAQDLRQRIFVLFDPPRKEHLGKPLSVAVTGDAKLVEFDPPEVLRAGESFSFELEWIAPNKPTVKGLTAEYLVKIDVIAPARMFQRV